VSVVDSVSAVRLQLVFSSLSHWHEGTRPKHLSKSWLPVCSLQEEPASSECPPEQGEQVVRGSLVVKPYSWRSIQASTPALRMATTGTTGAVLTLPPGLVGVVIGRGEGERDGRGRNGLVTIVRLSKPPFVQYPT